MNEGLLDIVNGTSDLAIKASQVRRKLFTLGTDFIPEWYAWIRPHRQVKPSIYLTGFNWSISSL